MIRRARALVMVVGLAAAAAGCGSSSGGANSVRPATHRGPTDRSWLVGAPIIGSPSEPPPFVAKRCSAGEMRATATTHAAAGGVVGVVTIVGRKVHTKIGRRRCSPAYGHGPGALLDANGNRLAVTSAGPHIKVNPPATFPYPIGATPQTWGFAWRGSWCGSHAAALVMPRGKTRYADAVSPRLVIPLRGPQPACRGMSDSTLVPGIAAFRHGPVETPPASWAALQANLHVPALHRNVRIGGLSVTLRNPTAKPIPLSPCPTYRIGLSRAHSGEMTGPTALSCTTGSAVTANGSLRIPLAFHSAAPTHVGRTLRFTFAMAGFPSATANGTVRR